MPANSTDCAAPGLSIRYTVVFPGLGRDAIVICGTSAPFQPANAFGGIIIAKFVFPQALGNAAAT